jgi:hypothetical protein
MERVPSGRPGTPGRYHDAGIAATFGDLARQPFKAPCKYLK